MRQSMFSVFALLLTYSATAVAMFMQVDREVPIDTVLPNVEKTAADNPKDAHAQYILGRIHSLAWASGGNQVRLVAAKQADGLPSFAPYASVQVNREKETKATPEDLKHLDASIAAYRKAVELDPKNGLYHLGLGWMLEQKMVLNANKPSTQPSDESPDMKRVLAAYIKAFDLRLEADKESKNRMMAGDTFVSAEAGRNAIRLLESIDPVDKNEIDRLQKGINDVFAKGMAITPIVVAMNTDAAPATLIDKTASVKFDFAGFGPEHQWPWVTPDAALLVWDPAGTGNITSGRQLFGTMTWQLLFRDGYEALATLDTNRDGELRGDELRGIAVWQDKNGNAVSDAGEVVPASHAGMAAIRVKASNDPTGVLRIDRGVTWRDGRTTMSFDWVPASK